MIRNLLHTDVPEVMELIEDFMVRLYGVDYNRSAAKDVMHSERCLADSLMIVSEKNNKIGGVFLGKACVMPFTGKTIMREVLWYAVDGSGFNLLRTAIEWSKEDYNVDEFHHTVVEPVDNKHIKILQRVGMTPVERSFVMKM